MFCEMPESVYKLCSAPIICDQPSRCAPRRQVSSRNISKLPRLRPELQPASTTTASFWLRCCRTRPTNTTKNFDEALRAGSSEKSLRSRERAGRRLVVAMRGRSYGVRFFVRLWKSMKNRSKVIELLLQHRIVVQRLSAYHEVVLLTRTIKHNDLKHFAVIYETVMYKWEKPILRHDYMLF